MSDIEELKVINEIPPEILVEFNKAGIYYDYVSAYSTGGTGNFYNKPGKFYKDIINMSLIWSDTPQGHEFWGPLSSLITDYGGYHSGIWKPIKDYMEMNIRTDDPF